MAGSRKTAFTLVEILVVAVILGISALIAAMFSSSGSQAHLSSAARDVVSNLQYAQSYAITKQRIVTVTYSLNATDAARTGYDISYVDPATSTVTVLPGPDGASLSRRFGSAARSSPMAATRLNAVNVNGATANNTILCFDQLGVPKADAACTVDLTAAATMAIAASDGRTMTVRVQPYSGAVLVSSP
jgi:prepilin-type N-terminal cleavage/methylation domain-containing protein